MAIYKLKNGLHCAVLMRAVSKCKGKVLLITARGDILDLTSELSRFVFVSAFGNAILHSTRNWNCRNRVTIDMLQSA